MRIIVPENKQKLKKKKNERQKIGERERERKKGASVNISSDFIVTIRSFSSGSLNVPSPHMFAIVSILNCVMARLRFARELSPAVSRMFIVFLAWKFLSTLSAGLIFYARRGVSFRSFDFAFDFNTRGRNEEFIH